MWLVGLQACATGKMGFVLGICLRFGACSAQWSADVCPCRNRKCKDFAGTPLVAGVPLGECVRNTRCKDLVA